MKWAACGTAPYLPAVPRGSGDGAGLNSFQPCHGPPAEVGEDHQWAVGYRLGNAGQYHPFSHCVKESLEEVPSWWLADPCSCQKSHLCRVVWGILASPGGIWCCKTLSDSLERRMRT